MARRKPRTREVEATEHARIAEAAVMLMTTLVRLEPEVHHFNWARKVIEDGIADLNERLKVETATAGERG